MTDPTSRYDIDATSADTPVKSRLLPDGRTIMHRERRFLPRADSLPLLAEISLPQGERLDQFSARTLGDPGLYWQICDANDAMSPDDLLAELDARQDRRVRIAMPRPPGA